MISHLFDKNVWILIRFRLYIIPLITGFMSNSGHIASVEANYTLFFSEFSNSLDQVVHTLHSIDFISSHFFQGDREVYPVKYLTRLCMDTFNGSPPLTPLK
jgi:hypothetical protein